MKSNASLVYNMFLVVGDFFALLGAFVGAYFVRAESSVPVAHPIAGETYLYIFLGLLPFWIIIFALLGLYNSNIYERRFGEIGRLLMGSFIGFLFVIFWDFITVSPIFPAKLVPVYGLIFAFILLVIFRNIARLIRTELFSYNIGLTRVALVGTSAATEELVDSLSDSRRSGYKLVAVVGDKQQVGERSVQTYPTFSAFTESAGDSPLHGIIQTELFKDEERNREVLEYAQTKHVSYRFIPGNTELFVGNIDVELFRNSIPVIAVRQTPLYGWGRVVKRLFDIGFGTFLFVLTSPIFVLVTIAELIGGGGSVFFRQNRLTRFNSTFRVFKFRTQYQKYDGTTPEQAFTMMGKPELGAAYRKGGDAIPDDPRITKLGKFLRATSLDELPQLINVIKGDLSLVGPRALIPEELSSFQRRHTILSVKSGLTGLAVVSGRRDIPFEERRKLDIYYVQNWSFWMDVVILIKTVRVVLERTGAK